MIQYWVSRDPFSYEPLFHENTQVFPEEEKARLAYTRAIKDYKAYMERREDAISKTKIEFFRKEGTNWLRTAEWEHTLPLKKMTVVNPELGEWRTKNGIKKKAQTVDALEAFLQVNPAPIPEEEELEDD